jgi:hypothetical protein
MRKPNFLLLAGVTLVFVVLAIVALQGGDSALAPAPSSERALPTLAPKLGELAWIRLTHGATKTNFAEIGGRWVVVEKSNYPAIQPKIRQMLVGLADLTLVEPKTERPQLFARLGVDDPTNGQSTQVTVQDRTGTTVAELIVGKRRTDRFGGGNDGVYVRKPGVDQAWLARGSLDVTGDLTSWLDRHILDIPEKRIASIKFTDETGTTLTLSRAAEGDKFTVADAPPDTKFKSPAALAEPAGALTNLDMTDVRPQPDLPVPDHDVATAAFTTFDGLTVELFLFGRGNVDWLGIDASGADGAATTEAKTINDKVARWTYAIPPTTAKLLRRKLADLVEPPKGS